MFLLCLKGVDMEDVYDRDNRIYICIDLKSYYASVECVYRKLDPLRANLLVADETRSDKTICLAVSPALKAIGVPSRPRLFEAKQKIREYEWKHRTKVDYIIAMPRMAEYERISAEIYSVYLRYVSKEDIHVYSIDECFIDVTPYLHFYEEDAERLCLSSPHLMAITMIRDVLAETGITATVGIGTNMYLAKVAMDIVAKREPADKDGVRIAELNEESYKYLLWDHQPLTDFWQIGPGKCARLNRAGIYTMGQLAAASQSDEEWFYKTFGIDAEILIDHAWGKEPVCMRDIKNYHASSHSLSLGQVLPRPYRFEEARIVFTEMIDDLCADLFRKNLTSREFSFWVSYDARSLDENPDYKGPYCTDFYGRLFPKYALGGVKFHNRTNQTVLIRQAMLEQFDQRINRRFYVRRFGLVAGDIKEGEGYLQLDLFTDYEALEKEKRIQNAVRIIRDRFGSNAVLKGTNYMEGGTARERNTQIGGHRA